MVSYSGSSTWCAAVNCLFHLALFPIVVAVLTVLYIRAKYPLAIVSKILEHLGDDTMIAYDIGCATEATVSRSSLGPEFQRKRAVFCVPAFHAYTHNHICQMRYHPNNIDGMGIEDVESLERVFGGLNQLAPIVRYSSAYRRRLWIETYFKQWDEDKDINTGTFLLNNYTQALEIIDQETAALHSLEYEGITMEEIDRWADEEEDYFCNLGEEAPYNVHAVAYVELLQKLHDLEKKKASTTVRFLDCSTDPANYSKQAAAARRAKRDRRYINEQVERVALDVCQLEVTIGVSPGGRWTPATPEYQQALQYLQDRKYHRALNKLQRLVVLRLFELSKLNVAKTGMHFSLSLPRSNADNVDF